MKIVEMTGLTYPTVRSAIDLYVEGGWPAIRPMPRGRTPGDGRLLTPDQEKQIQRAIIDKRPEQLKMDFCLWSRAAVMQLIEQELTCPEIETLKSFNGIDTVSAIGLLLEIGTVERFAAVKSISCYFGLHPKFKQSGDKVMGVHMSKQGSKNMRKILFNIAKGAITFNPLIKEIYEKKVSQGMSKMAAIGVCMHKILRIIYGLLKNKQSYNPLIDKQNCERSKDKQLEKQQQENANIEKNRRFQKFDAKAPISRKQTKKREEHVLSQSEITSPARDLHAPPEAKLAKMNI